MNASFAAYVASARVLAEGRGLKWDLPCDDAGRIARESRWDLTALVGMIPPPSIHVSDFGVENDAFGRLNEVRRQMGQPELQAVPMGRSWRDLYLAVIIHQLLVRKNKPRSALVPARWIRHLASAAGDTPPWAVTPDQVRQAYNAALLVGDSGKNALNFDMTVRTVLDDQHLADTPALARFCVPLGSDSARQSHERSQGERARVNASFETNRLRSRLSERKSAAKLPEEQAFWEMVRIVFTETPRSFSDAIRFAILKLGIITGLRVGEVVLLPLDCRRWREYVDADGQPAGGKGGQSRSLMLRHFAEKQVEDEGVDGVCLYENAHHIPPMFEEIVLQTLSTIEELTAPLRRRLRRQVETGRLFPEYPVDALVPAHEMFTRLSGNAIFSNAELPAGLEARYRETLDSGVLDELRDIQLAGAAPFQPASVFWLRPRKAGLIAIRNKAGEIVDRVEWRDAFLRVGDVEAYVRANMPTKIPDLKPATLTDGSLIYPHELMFLMPIRNLIEGRNGGLLDPTRYFAAGRISTFDIQVILDGSQPESIFRRYGADDEDRQLSLNPHALRHLQTTELFRLGVADTIITKRFNRRSVAQSYEYDHRSLAEDLANIDVPEPAEGALSDNARQVYRMIAANKVSGPIIDEFRRIQHEHGDGVAFEYLNAEADGLHVTPYGFCVNSFAVDPCPKHLECFNGCRHLARSEVDEEREHLERLRDRMASVITTLEALPEHQRSVGWHNQIVHARTRLANILTTLDTSPGQKPFPDGPDLYRPAESRRGTSVLDTVTFLQDGL
ncbi:MULTISPECIES: hypothetical protein [Bradyrhizobium]|uniref:Integrase n=1 Tax=Bradyrhizobium ottawaense TaxID=931866 RepID=A0ABV4FHK3_9BRAD|nr:hypothetical protein [Bradyrhizobium sp. CCBAU 15615]